MKEIFDAGTIPDIDDLREWTSEARRGSKRATDRKDLANKQFLTKSADMTSVSKELSKCRRELTKIREEQDQNDSLETTLDDEKSSLEKDSFENLDRPGDSYELTAINSKENLQNLKKLETTLIDLEEDYAAMKQGKKLFQVDKKYSDFSKPSIFRLFSKKSSQSPLVHYVSMIWVRRDHELKSSVEQKWNSLMRVQ